MAIKLPDPGNGIPEQKTGNDEWTNMNIVRDNFADRSNAASRLVGTATGNVAEMTSEGVAGTGWGTSSVKQQTTDTIVPKDLSSGVYVFKDGGTVAPPNLGVYDRLCLVLKRHTTTAGNAIWFPYGTGSTGNIVIEQFTGSTRNFYTLYSDKNTTKDTATGFLKTSSPVLHVYNDSITKIHEAEQLDITVDKKGVGHYEIHGTTGLRKNDGWFMSPPRDVHGNVLCMVDLDEKDGIVILKTYKKKFDFETVSIVHDYESPMDIPEGVCVEFRFNDLPQEQLDELIE